MRRIALFLSTVLLPCSAYAVAPDHVHGGASNVYNVLDYGAKCDNRIIYGGISTTASSGNVSALVPTWSAADIGATVDISIGTFNSYSASPLTAYNGTITGFTDSEHITVSATFPTFTSASGAGMRWYHTVDTAAIQKALDAANASNAGTPGGAQIVIPDVSCATGQLTVYSNERISGSNQAASVLMQANGQNADIFQSYGYNSLINTNSTGGVHDVAIENLTLDGNRGGNTGSGIGTATGTGDLIRLYGYHLNMHDVTLMNQAADGWFSQWSTSAGSPVDENNNIGPAGMEADLNHNTCSYGAGWCVVWDGPHDSRISHFVSLSEGTGGLLNGPDGNGSPINVLDWHGYQEPTDISFPYQYSSCDGCYAEGLMYIGAFNNIISNTRIGNLTLGTSGSVHDLTMANDIVGTLNNVTGTSHDFWSGGSIGTLTGASYTPIYVFGTSGLPSGTQNSFSITNGSSYPALFTQSSGSVLSLTDNLASQTWDSAGNVTLGIGGLSGTATNGYAYMPTCSADPSGTPVTKTGFVPRCYNPSDNKEWIWNGSGWKYVQAN